MPGVPPRAIAIPTSVSPEAQAYLASPPTVPPMAYPPLQDLAGWRKLAASIDDLVLSALTAINPAGSVVGHIGIGNAGVFTIAPPNASPDDARICLDIHGGGLITGGGECCRATGIFTATRFGMHTWTVDYRMPPDHPFPAALDDCLAAYRALLAERSPGRIVIGGSSAGGNLAVALILRARDEGLPLPAAAVLMTPAADLTEAGDSHQTNLGLDPLIPGSGKQSFLLYAAGQDLSHPYVSPLNGDFAPGFPPAILTTGTRDMLLSDTVLLHRALRRAGIPAELHVTEAAGHGGFMGRAPEDQEILAEVRRFAETHWAR